MKASAILGLVTIVLLAACDGHPTVPVSKTLPTTPQLAESHGNGIPIDITFPPIACPNGETIDLRIQGWFRVPQRANPNSPELAIFHLTFTFANAEGDTFVWLSAGPQLITDKNGEPVIMIAGRAEAGDGHVGLLILGTDQVVTFEAGRSFGSLTEQACLELS